MLPGSTLFPIFFGWQQEKERERERQKEKYRIDWNDDGSMILARNFKA